MTAKIPIAMTVAGSDSSGGAGIQADLKTFAALGVYGASAITSITAQSTQSITAIEDLSAKIIRQQIREITQDLHVGATKTGMLHTEEIIRAVAEEFSNCDFAVVVDPVMIAKAGSQLLEPNAIEAFKTLLLPKATVITPNRFEAEKLAGIEVKNIENAKTAAEIISKMGPKAVVIKGGHLEEENAIDLLYYEGKFQTFSTMRLNVTTTHGTGCSFSAAIAAGLAKGSDIPTATEKAKEIITLGVKFGLNIGSGYGPVNPLADLYRESSRYLVIEKVEQAKKIIQESKFSSLIPEVGLNIAMAIPNPVDGQDIASIDGRITKTSDGPRAVGSVKFGCSSHLARYILEIVKHDQAKVAVMNVKFSDELLRALKESGLAISHYDREEEPENVRLTEGMTVPWGVDQAIKRAGKVPDAIYHKGGMGKEPMIVLLGSDPSELARIALQLSSRC